MERVDGRLTSNIGNIGNSDRDTEMLSSLATFTITIGVTIFYDAINFSNISNASTRVSNFQRTVSCLSLITESWSSRDLERVNISSVIDLNKSTNWYTKDAF